MLRLALLCRGLGVACQESGRRERTGVIEYDRFGALPRVPPEIGCNAPPRWEFDAAFFGLTGQGTAH